MVVNKFERDGVKSIVYQMDCVEFMKGCADNQFDLAIVDPPYGINIENSGTHFKKYETKGWDSVIPTKEYFEQLKRVSKNQIVWGGNYMMEYLNSTPCFIIWDKVQPEEFSMAMCEFAWTSFKSTAKIYKKRVVGADDIRIHPTQKLVALYKWLLKNYSKPNDTILDTHLGSQSSRIATYEYGLNFTGCELDEDYFEQGNKRFENHIKQLKLF